MEYINKSNKQVTKKWLCLESMLSFIRTSNQYITIPKNDKNSFEYTSSWSIRLICTHSSYSEEYLYDNFDTTTQKGFYIKITNGTSVVFYLKDGTTANTVTATIPIEFVSKYKRITVTYTSSTKTLRLIVGNFADVSQVLTITSSIVNTQALTIGNNFANTQGLQGSLGLISIYNSAINAANFSDITKEIGLVPKVLHGVCCGFWNLQERYGNKAYDLAEQFNYAKETITNVNSGFDTDTTWTKSAAWTISGGKAVGLTATGYNSGFQNILKTAPVIVDRTYRIRFTVDSVTGGCPGVKVILGDTYNDIVYGAGTYDFYKTAQVGGYIGLQLVANGTNGYGATVDNFIVDAYSHAPITANHGTLTNYTNTELGIPTYTTQTAKLNFYIKSTATFWNGSGNDLKSGFSDITNALLLDGSHTISYPLAGTTALTFKGYTYMAYKLKTGQTLTPKEVMQLNNNTLFANPSKSILAKFDAFYNFNSIDTTSGNRIMDLIGTNHATLTGSGFTIVTINSLR